MNPPLLNQPAPDFTCEAHNGQRVRLADYRGRHVVVLYFYPMDGTPICTKEACSFRDSFEEFTKLGAVVIGVSADSLERHRAFAASRALSFLLLSDQDGFLQKAYQVPKTLGILPGRVPKPDGMMERARVKPLFHQGFPAMLRSLVENHISHHSVGSHCLPVARQLRRSLLDYAAGDEFNPKTEIGLRAVDF